MMNRDEDTCIPRDCLVRPFHSCRKAIALLPGWLIFAVLILSHDASEAQETHIVTNGSPNAEIIISDDPERTVPIAAEEFQTYIEKISGAVLPIRNEPSSQSNIKIYLGSSSYTDNLGVTDEGLEYDAYRMVSGDNWLVLLGRDDNFEPVKPFGGRNGGYGYPFDGYLDAFDELTGYTWDSPYKMLTDWYDDDLDIWIFDGRGTLNAVYAFLRDLGVRWYFPGELGECVPSMDTISYADMDRTVHPDFELRRFYQYFTEWFRASTDDIKWELRLGTNSGRQTQGLVRSHGMLYLLDREEQKQNHPEYYALWDGQRQTDDPAPCLSSDSDPLFSETLEFVKTHYDHYGDNAAQVSPTDGYNRLCETSTCSHRGTPDREWRGRYSDYVHGWENKVATELYKTHPDKMIVGSAYGYFALPPLNIESFSPNYTVRIARWRTWLLNPDSKNYWEDLRNGWLQKISSDNKIYYSDYYLHNRNHEHFSPAYQGIPALFPHLIKENLSTLKGISGGEFIEVYRNGSYDYEWHALATMHLNMYVTARLWWDADQNVDEMLNEYYNKFYGPAADQMKSFVDYSEANWKSAQDDHTVWDEMRRLLSSAIAAAEEDNIYRQRINMIDEFMKVHSDNTDGAEASYYFEEDVKICESETYTWQGETYHSSGTYYDSLTTVSGADSIYQLNLSVYGEKFFKSQDAEICQNEVYTWHGRDYSESGTYYDSLLTVHGCDSVYELNLHVNAVNTEVELSDSTLTAQAPSGNYNWWDCSAEQTVENENDQRFSPQESGHYALVMEQNGCVDTSSCYHVVLEDTGRSYYFIEEEEICQGNSLMWHGQDYSDAGVYYDSLTTVYGKDSVYQLNLTVYDGFFFTRDATICDGDTFNWRGEDYTLSGSYSDSLITVHGCDSVYRLNLSVSRVDTAVDASGNYLVAQAARGNYNWIDCVTGQQIEGEDSKSFYPGESGHYALVIEQSGCTDTSSCYHVELQDTRISDPSNAEVLIYPNPAQDLITIEAESIQKVAIYNTKGQLLDLQQYPGSHKVMFHLSDYSQAAYILHINTTQKAYRRLIVVQ